jgi:hypothetical protein
MNEKDELELLKFWNSNPGNISKIPYQLKPRINEEDVAFLMSKLEGDNIIKSIDDRLRKLQEVKVQKESISLKHLWKTFIFYGIFIIIISTIASALISNKLNEVSLGPVCRIETNMPYNQFSINRSTEFTLPYLFVNLRNQKQLIEKTEVFCYWAPITQTERIEESSKTGFPSSEPQKIPQIDELDSIIIRSICRSPDISGNYTIKINVNTNKGLCTKELVMNVV